MTVLSAVPSDPRASGLSYEPFYGLKEQPFSLSPDVRFFYRSRLHATAFEDLRIAIERRERVMVANGDIGTGKTMLCRALAADLDRRAALALVPDPALSRAAFLKSLLSDFGAASLDDLSTRMQAFSEADLRRLLCAHLQTLAESNTIALVIVDEAQRMSADIADEVTVLADAEDPLHVILAGQLDLVERLAAHDMRRLDQRASARCTLMPLDRAGVAGYIAHRLQKAGGSPDRISFSDAAIDAVYEGSSGVPRVVNRLCDRALAAAHAQRASVIDRDMIPAPSRPASQARAAIQPPAAEDADAVESWIARIDDGPGRPAVIAIADTPATPMESAPEPPMDAPAERRTGVVLRIRIPRRSHRRRQRRMERRSDRWARRVGNILLTLTILLAGAAVAPSLITMSNSLWSHVRTAFVSPAPHRRP